ncbi:MAG: hypothetical protein U0610_16270 [bacterium]
MTSEGCIAAALAFVLLAGCGDFHRGAGDGSGGSDVPTFAADIHPILMSHCAGCHKPSNKKMPLSGDATRDYTTVSALVVAGDSAASLLQRKATGAVSHGGGTPLPANGAEALTVASWIDGGALP